MECQHFPEDDGELTTWYTGSSERRTQHINFEVSGRSPEMIGWSTNAVSGDITRQSNTLAISMM
jgi:hypothetical protein